MEIDGIMVMEKIKSELPEYTKSLDIIDSHDHLPTETETLNHYLFF